MGAIWSWVIIINKSNGKIIETPNKKDAIRNFPGSGNLSDFQIIIPNKCRSFEKLLKNKKVKNYIDDRKPKKETLTNLKVTILYINHDYETRDGLSSSLVGLWKDLFKYIGVENYEIIKQLDIK